MNKKKLIHRHSKTRRFLMKAHYDSVMGLRMPVTLTFAGLAVIGCYMTLISIALVCAMLYDIITGRYIPLQEALRLLAVYFPLLLASLTGDYILFRIICAYVRLPKGHLLNPLPPAVNEVLPEAEVLVRASIATDAAQKEILLRPAAATDETAPQTLLRAANGVPNP